VTQLSPPPEILVLGDPRLRERCTAVEQVDRGELARLAAGLAEARARLGFGRAIAAPQIGIPRRIVMVNLGAGPFPVINPEITWRSDELFELWDDCLSVPDRLIRVRRHRSISLAFRDEQLRPRIWRELPPELAELLQHEIDHLDGVLMVDRAIDEAASRPIGERGALVDAARRGHRLSLDRIAEAARTIDPVFLRTPQYVCEPLAELAGCRLTIKVETANPIRSFKGRGADFTVATRVARGDRAPVACASAGNFGQGMAYACRARGLPITVFAAHGANPLKLARMAALGAEVRIAGADLEEAKQTARAWAAGHGAQFVEDGEDPQVSEGAGSIAVELLGSGEAFDAVVVPVGGRLRGLPPPEPRMPDTIADGIAVRRPIAASLDDMRDTVDDFVEVDDAALIAAMRALHGHAGLVGEPAGVAGLAAVLAGRAALDGQRVATVICGGNATRQHLIEYEILGAAERPA